MTKDELEGASNLEETSKEVGGIRLGLERAPVELEETCEVLPEVAKEIDSALGRTSLLDHPIEEVLVAVVEQVDDEVAVETRLLFADPTVGQEPASQVLGQRLHPEVELRDVWIPAVQFAANVPHLAGLHELRAQGLPFIRDPLGQERVAVGKP